MANEHRQLIEDAVRNELANNPKAAAFTAAVKSGDRPKALGILNSMHALKLLDDVMGYNYKRKLNSEYVNGTWVLGFSLGERLAKIGYPNT
jgi:hypothetical protein